MANGIPKQVEEADRLAREFVAGLNGEAEVTDEETTEEEEKTEEEEAEPEAEEEESPEEETETEEEEAEESEETDSEEEEASGEDGTWEQRYKTLKGMFEAETKKYNTELADWKKQVFDRLGNMSTPVVQEATEEPAETPEDVQAFIEEMGPEYIEKLNKYMEYMFKPMVDSSIRPVAEKVDDVEDATLKAAQTQFSDYLDTKVNGDWKDLMEGGDEGFIEFLNSPDPSGLYTNGQLMKLYNDNWDADRLATLLNSYIGEPVKEEPKPKAKKPANVQPKRKTPNSQPVEEGEKKIWSQADIKELEKAERDGKLTAEESKAQFADLLAAANEGRIRG